MAKAKGSLLSKTSLKKKPIIRTKNKVIDYGYSLHQAVVYMGNVIDGYSEQTATIIGRSKTHQAQSYKIQFQDGQVIDTTFEILMSEEEYEARNSKTDEVVDCDVPFTPEGLESLHNPRVCFNPMIFYQMGCDNECHFEERCVFHGKGQYKKFSLQ